MYLFEIILRDEGIPMLLENTLCIGVLLPKCVFVNDVFRWEQGRRDPSKTYQPMDRSNIRMMNAYGSRRSQPPMLTPFTVPFASTLQSKLEAPLELPPELEPPTEISIETLPPAPPALVPSADPVWLTSGQSHGSLHKSVIEIFASPR